MEAVKEKVQLQKYPTYQDSGVEWLGEIPEHWEIKRLGSLLKPISEKNKPELPLLSITREKGVIERNIEDEDENHNYIPDDLSGYKVLRKGQFGMNKMKAWQGSYGISKFTGIVSPAYYVFDFYYEVDPDYFNTAIRSKKYISFFGSASDGVRIGQWDLSKTRMKQIPFILPPKKEQRAIATFLDEKCGKIDIAIAQKQQLIELLKERKQIIIQNAVTKGLYPDVKMKDSGVEWIGQIPEHWEVKKIKHLARIRSGESITNTELKDEGKYEVFGGNGLMGYTSKFNVEDENIIIGRVGAYCGNIRLSKKKRWISDNALILSLKYKKLYAFICLVLSAANLNNLNTSSAQPLITGTKVLNFSIPFPPTAEQDNILQIIKSGSEKIDTSINLQQQQIEKLKEYKSSLIDAAVTGKIKVS